MRIALILFSLMILTSPVLAQALSDEAWRAKLKQISAGIVEEKHDEFDRKTRAKYNGPVIKLAGDFEVMAFLSWKDDELQKPMCVFGVMRVSDNWRWLKYSDTKMLIDGQLVDLTCQLSKEVLDGGSVYECQWIEMRLEDVARWAFADVVKLRIGLDEWTLEMKDRLPMVTVLAHWLSRGGDLKPFKDNLIKLLKPSIGDSYAEVVKTFGEPEKRSSESGWAEWAHFTVRFENGRAMTIRKKDTKKAAQ